MKPLFVPTLLLGTILSAQAGSITYTPSPSDLGDLDHHAATTWGITGTLPAPSTITGATLTFKNIWDWRVENDVLHIHLLNNPAKGVVTKIDNTTDTDTSDYFLNQGVLLKNWTDPLGGKATGFDLVINFTASQLTSLKSYIADGSTTTSAVFGFGIDPDCHYFNDGVSFKITTVPDGGSTVALLGVGLLGLAALSSRRTRA